MLLYVKGGLRCQCLLHSGTKTCPEAAQALDLQLCGRWPCSCRQVNACEPSYSLVTDGWQTAGSLLQKPQADQLAPSLGSPVVRMPGSPVVARAAQMSRSADVAVRREMSEDTW